MSVPCKCEKCGRTYWQGDLPSPNDHPHVCNMIEFSGVSMDPKLNHCDVPGCKNGACTSAWNYPGVPGRRQTNVCGWHVKELCK